MKYFSQIILIIIFCCQVLPLKSQNSAPHGFNYQAIARDFNGAEISSRDILVRVSIFAGQSGGDLVWREIHSTTTNKFGLFTIVIGVNPKDAGSKASFSEIQWGSAAHFLQVEIDFKDGKGYLPTGKNQLFSVPYALYSNYAANGGSGGFYDRQNLAYTDSSFLLLINNDGTIQSSLKNDFDPKNEIQDLQIANNILKITNNSDANEINLSPYLDNTDNQTLYNSGDSIGISNGNKVNLKRFYQQLNMGSDSLEISNGNAVSIKELKNPESVYFNVEKKSSTATSNNIEALKFPDAIYEGINYNPSSGIFTVLHEGLYSFYLIYEATISQKVVLVVQNNDIDEWTSSNLYNEKLRIPIMYYLKYDDTFYIKINTNNTGYINKAVFSGFKAY